MNRVLVPTLLFGAMTLAVFVVGERATGAARAVAGENRTRAASVAAVQSAAVSPLSAAGTGTGQPFAGEWAAAPASLAPAPAVIDLAPGDTIRVLTLDEMRWLDTYFPDATMTFARISWCESNWRDDVGSEDGAIGRLQILGAWARKFGYEPADLHDPDVNGFVGAQLAAARPDLGDWAATVNGCATWHIAESGQ